MTDPPEGSIHDRGVRTDGGDTAAEGGAEDTPSDTLGGRIGGSRARTWLLLNANRRHVAAVFALSMFLVIVLASALDIAPMRQVVREQTALWWVFSPLIGAVITGVTLVVTFTQLVLSQELGSLGDQRDRMGGAIDFRDDVESWLDTAPTPPDPSSFLAALLDGVEARAQALQTAADDCDDDAIREEVAEFVTSLTDQTAAVGEGLENTTFGEFDVLYSALDFNYSWKIYEAKRLRHAHDEELTEEARAAVDDLVEGLKFFGPAREHFKTLYFQWELINLSRVMLYAAFPALSAAFFLQLYVSPSSFPGTYLGVDGLVWVVAAGVTVTLVPFCLLTAYILRIVTIAKRTLAIGPFILRDTDRTEESDWE
jgi:hypothetical protein